MFLKFILLWAVFWIIELMFWNLYFLGIWVASILLATKIFIFKITNPVHIAIMFGIFSLTSLFLVFIIKKKYLNNKKETSFIWEVMPVQSIHNEKVIYIEWQYWLIKDEKDLKEWDMVKILDVSGQIIDVEKIV